MTVDLSLETLLCLQHELEEALANYWHYVEIGDINLSKMWIEQADIILEKIASL